MLIYFYSRVRVTMIFHHAEAGEFQKESFATLNDTFATLNDTFATSKESFTTSKDMLR